jgi:hypothetical protein
MATGKWKRMDRWMSLLQNPVCFASALAVSRRRTFGSRAAKRAFSSGGSFETEFLKEPRMMKAPVTGEGVKIGRNEPTPR